jgi:hypothetical protein
MAENVEYILSLKDMFTGKINAAESAAKGLNFTMKELATTAAGFFGVYAGVDFLKSSAEAFNEAEKSSAQLSATLTSTGFAAGRTKEQLDAQAESLMKLSTFDDDAITGAQSLLLTFTNIRGEILDKTTPAVLDLATKMGGDLKGASIQVGKALNDPIQGMTALKRVGVSFSETQRQTIKNLQETGDLAGAQKIILAELNKEFGGSAQADANTYSGQMKIMAHEFQNVKEELGYFIMKLVVSLKPAFEKAIELFQGAIDFARKYKTELQALGIFVGILGGAWLMYTTYIKAAAAYTTVMEGAMWLLNVAMDANPIGIVVIALAGLAAILYELIQHFETVERVARGAWEVLTHPGEDVSEAWNRGYNQISGRKSRGASGSWGEETKTATAPGTVPPMDTSAPSKTPKASSATGQKSYNINIKIDNLIKEQNINTTNIKEGADKIRELVTSVLLSAVNDSQMIGER